MCRKKVSIVVVNWNGKEHLKYCLPSLKKINYPNYEVIVVDNGSTDGSQAYVKRYHFWVKLIENQKNLGYVGGNNVGIEQSDGDYILVLNNDTKVTPEFLKIMVEDMEKDEKIGCLGPKILCLYNKTTLDVAGSFFTDTGFLYHYGYLQDASLPMYNKKREFFCVKGACLLLRKSLVDKIGAFDEDYFNFFEETDLCHRIWLSGYKVIYEPKAIIYHYGAGTASKEISEAGRIFWALKNRIDSYLKNLELINVLKIFLVLSFIYGCLFWIYFLTGKFENDKAIFKAVFANIKNLPKIFEKRALVQRLRKVSDKEIFQKTRRNPPLPYYYYLFTNLKNYRYREEV